MILQPGCRFAVAPRFHLPSDWTQRLLIGAGVEEISGCFFPRHAWRPPTPTELSLLVHPSDEPTTLPEGEACVVLFQLPAHIQSEWWQLLEQAAEVLGQGRLPGFETFVNRVGDFLAFKGLPLPEGARCDVVVTHTAQQPLHGYPDAHRAMGLLGNPFPWAPESLPGTEQWPRLWGGINLGDEATSLVLINLNREQLAAELRRRFPDQPRPPTVGEIPERFLHLCSDYPPVRLILGPGEGFRLPKEDLILAGYREGKQGPDVLMTIAHATQPSG